MTREEAKELLLNISAYDIDMQRGMAKQEAIEMAIKALEQEPIFFPPCQDCNIKMDKIRMAYDKLQKKEPCEDAISRQAAIDALTKTSGIRGDALKSLYDLPSVSTEKTGWWIEHEHDGISHIECSGCSTWFLRMYLTRNSYCPNCGRKMLSQPYKAESEEV